jgi:hypothetical protein
MKLAILKLGELSCLVSDPESAIVILVEGRDPAGFETFGVSRIEHREPHPVKSQKSLISSEPDVTITGLHDRSDRAGQRALLDGPEVIEPGCGGGAQAAEGEEGAGWEPCPAEVSKDIAEWDRR